jgi:hypothetical protein
LKAILLSQDAIKMNIFLSFLLSRHKLNKFIREEWIKVFDLNYVDNVVIHNLLQNKTKISDCLNKISEKATGLAEK